MLGALQTGAATKFGPLPRAASAGLARRRRPTLPLTWDRDILARVTIAVCPKRRWLMRLARTAERHERLQSLGVEANPVVGHKQCVGVMTKNTAPFVSASS
jgi:hypothetical protein